MPYARPTLTELRNQALQDITSSGLPHLDGLLRNSVLRVLAWVMAGLAYSVYGFLDWISLESVPYTATDEYLEAWAALIGVYRLDATAASGSAQFTGTAGRIIPNGTALIAQGSVPYVSTAEAIISAAGVAALPFTATVTGAMTNCGDGTSISLATPIAGIQSNGLTVGPTVGGADQETDAALRTRMLRAYAAPPHGGSATDYVEWATDVPGCTRVWVDPQGQGPGTVVLYVMFDDVNASSGGFPIGTDGGATKETRIAPATGDQLLVANHIWPLQPVTALVYVQSPHALPVNVTLIDLDPADTETQAAILTSLHDLFRNISDVGGTIFPSDLYQAVLATPGVNHFVMTAPTMPVVATGAQLPVLGTFTASL